MSVSKLGNIFGNIKKTGFKLQQQSSLYAKKKKDNTIEWGKLKRNHIFSLPLVSLIDSKLRYMFSQDNLDNMQIKYYQYYHWLAGTEVTEVQERARYLESRLNMNRKEMRENRELLDNVTERLRSITSELEHTGRGDLKHLHLRQQEYDTIQEELKLSRLVQKSEFQERETFTMLMNAVRESHETERNYNQRIKMISLIGAILGPFIGYLFSARLNKIRFQKMEEVINTKLNLLRLSTIDAIREIHGLEPDVMPEPEKLSIIKRLIMIYEFVKANLIETFKNFSALKDIDDKMHVAVNEKKILSKLSEKKDAAVQAVSEIQPEPKLIAPRIVDKVSIPDLKSVLSSLKTIEEKQSTLQNQIATSQELQNANKIEVSVNSSDEEIIKVLQADQSIARKSLLSLQDQLKILQISFDRSLKDVQSNMDSLSMKMTNSSELYMGNLEHSKILNDLSQSLTEIKENIETIEAIYSNDISKEFCELNSIRDDLRHQIEGIKENREMQIAHFDEIKKSFASTHKESSKIKEVIYKMGEVLEAVHCDNSTAVLLQNVEDLTESLNEIKVMMNDSVQSNEYDYHAATDFITNRVTEHFEELEDRMNQQQMDFHASVMEKLEQVAMSPAPIIERHECPCQSATVSGNLIKLEENLTQHHENVYSSLLEKLEEMSKPPMHTLRYDRSSQTESSDIEFSLPAAQMSVQSPPFEVFSEEYSDEIDHINSPVVCERAISDQVVKKSHLYKENNSNISGGSIIEYEIPLHEVSDVPVHHEEQVDGPLKRHSLVYLYSTYVLVSAVISFLYR